MTVSGGNCEYVVPLWCVEIIIALRLYNEIKLNIAMPYEEQSTNWVEEYRKRFFSVQAKSNHVEIVSYQYSDDFYDRADEYMIDDSDLLLIVGTKHIGTHCLKYESDSGVDVDFFEI